MQKLLTPIFLLLCSFYLIEYTSYYDAARLFGWAGIISGVIIILLPVFKAVFSSLSHPSEQALDYSPDQDSKS